MIDERAFLAQLESANADELAQLLRRPSADEERLLEIYFGRARLQRLRSLALATPRRAVPRGNVVVLHGIMGGELTVYPTPQSSQFIWMNIPRLALGAAGWLRMQPNFQTLFDVRSTGIIKKYYAEQLLGLTAGGWKVVPFWYDWRQDLAKIADVLRKQIDANFGTDAPVHLVAHSMGGLVSRTYIQRHPDRWRKGGRLVMLGTPNHGSFAIPQVITGAYDTIRKLALLDLTHSLRSLCDILNTLPGSMQMLPSPLAMASMARMYDASLWAPWGVPQRILDLARASHDRLAKIVDGDRMTYVAGCNQVTKVDVKDWSKLDRADAYRDSLEGDGTVPHALGFLRDGNTRIPTYFVECSHGALPNHTAVIAATQDLLGTGKCGLPTAIPATRSRAEVAARAEVKAASELAEEEQLRVLSRKVNARSRAAGGAQDAPLTTDEMKMHEIILRSFLADSSAPSDRENAPIDGIDPTIGKTPAPGVPPRPPAPTVGITVRLVRGGIQELGPASRDADAISVGHYIGVAPQNAELAIDREISAALAPNEKGAPALLITDLCRRGVIVGELGHNFLLPDPRDRKRTIVIAGMGRAGNFREAELAVLARELTWTLGRSGRKHLCTVLIGAGAGNLETADAVYGWLRGVRRALHDAESAAQPRLESITFVEYAADNFVHLHTALESAVIGFANDPETPLRIDYTSPSAKELAAARRAAVIDAAKQAKAETRASFKQSSEATADREPMRLTVQLQGDTFQFAALTADASIPQRETRIDPVLVDEANREMSAVGSFAKQLDQGHLLGRLLLPQDMRELIVNQRAPVVLALDAVTARIHWETVAMEAADSRQDFEPELFFGTLYGLTRQLRTTFAQLPEPPLLSGRPLRVLVVADPAEDAPLPGAQEEGEAVAAIFEEFGREPDREVEVVRLFGPGQATRVAVLDKLINQRFDILHFAGHCFYKEDDPPASGWVFTGGKVLSAHELNRVDRIPRFVFSNACQSGITPDQANARVAPSFAEAFFARGVSNFICTAWEVDDAAALAFARRFYRGVLRLRGPGQRAEALHEAMKEARREVALMGLGGMQTWGAYQHYGDPNMRFIPRTQSAPAAAAPAAKKTRPAKKKPGKRVRKTRRRQR